MRGKASDISARFAHERRQDVSRETMERYQMTTYALAMPISSEAAMRPRHGIANLGNRWRPGHGKRHPWRRRHEPYWGENTKETP